LIHGENQWFLSAIEVSIDHEPIFLPLKLGFSKHIKLPVVGAEISQSTKQTVSHPHVSLHQFRGFIPMVMNPLFAKTPKFQMVKSSFKVKPIIFYGQFAHLLMAKPSQTRIYPSFINIFSYMFIMFPSFYHHFPFIFYQFPIIFPSFTHHLPINSPSILHHFPIIFPSIPHHFPIIFHGSPRFFHVFPGFLFSRFRGGCDWHRLEAGIFGNPMDLGDSTD
jgi:hypothetical protein